MELFVFDLDGTLLNKESAITDYTKETLLLMGEQGIAYTIATGRTFQGARAALAGHPFLLPQAYKNGVMIWHPETEHYSRGATLTTEELANVIRAFQTAGLTPFIFALEDQHESTVYHPPIRTEVERQLVRSIGVEEPVNVKDLSDLPADATITHINGIGTRESIDVVLEGAAKEPHLVAYSGIALEGQEWCWLDIHHRDASKGDAITTMRDLLGADRVICFGDSDNDLSMFQAADESYATANAHDHIQSAATDVIGHHDEDGVARYLRQRFAL